MKKKLFIISLVTLVGVALTACNDNNEKEIEYATYTTEQNKQNIENEGLQAIEKLDGLKTISAIAAIQDLTNLIYKPISPTPMYSAISRILAPVAVLGKNRMELATLRSTNSNLDSIGSFIRDNGGVYTYNSTVDTFAYVKSTSEITFKFPIGNSLTNNGKVTINNFTSQFSTNSDFPGKEEPKSLDITLWNGNNVLLSFVMDATYNADNIPSNITTIFTFKEGFTFTQEMTNNQSDVTLSLAFALNGANILNGTFHTKGNYSYENMSSIENMDDRAQVAKFLNEANAFVQLGNLKVTGALDFTKLMDQYDKEFPNVHDESSQANVDKYCDFLNNNASIILLYADQNTAIAKSTFYTTEHSSEWQWNGHQYTEYSYFSPGMKFIFKDDSAIDDSFFNSGFEDFTTSFETFLSELDNSYANN